MSKHLYRILLLLPVLFYSARIAGQNEIPIIWETVNEELKGYEVHEMFGSGDSLLYVFRYNKRKKHPYAVQRLSVDSLHTLASHIFTISKINDSDIGMLSPVVLNGRPYFTTVAYQPKSDTIHLYALPMNPVYLTSGAPIRLASVEKTALESEKDPEFYSNHAGNKFMLIIPRESDSSKNEKYELLLFSDSLNVLDSREIEIPYPAGIIEYNDAVLDLNGNAYILASRKNTNLSGIQKDRNIGRDFSLFIYNWEQGTLLEKSLSLGSKWLYDVRLLVNKDNNIQIVGYYSNMIDLMMAGTFSLELDPASGEVLHQGLSPFERSFRTRFRPRSGSISETELGMFNLNRVFVKENGTAQLISEKNYTETTSVFNPGTGTYTVITIYNYDEILISSIERSSAVDYNLVIPKFQSSTFGFDSYTSFVAFEVDDKTFILYNDSDRNKTLSLESDKGYRQLTGTANATTQMVVIHEKGQSLKIPLYDASKEYPVLNPHYYYLTSDGVILVAGSGYDMRFMKVKLK